MGEQDGASQCVVSQSGLSLTYFFQSTDRRLLEGLLPLTSSRSDTAFFLWTSEIGGANQSTIIRLGLAFTLSIQLVD